MHRINTGRTLLIPRPRKPQTNRSPSSHGECAYIDCDGSSRSVRRQIWNAKHRVTTATLRVKASAKHRRPTLHSLLATVLSRAVGLVVYRAIYEVSQKNRSVDRLSQKGASTLLREASPHAALVDFDNSVTTRLVNKFIPGIERVQALAVRYLAFGAMLSWQRNPCTHCKSAQ